MVSPVWTTIAKQLSIGHGSNEDQASAAVATEMQSDLNQFIICLVCKLMMVSANQHMMDYSQGAHSRSRDPYHFYE